MVNGDRSRTRILVVEDGPTGLAMARTERPDLIVLDVMMPGLSGLALGADDFVTKPFSVNLQMVQLGAF